MYFTRNVTDVGESNALEAYWASIVDWAQGCEAEALSCGRSLSVGEAELADAVGVRLSGKVRLYRFTKLPEPDSPGLVAAANLLGFKLEGTRGITFGYGIWLSGREAEEDRGLLAHELRHVAQMEWLGGLEPYLKAYLRELQRFGYPKGPLEVDAHQKGATHGTQ
ncbi:MAG: DUF4157 domain-containing protein [Opitutales bacterium]